MSTFDVNTIRADFPNLGVSVNDKPLVYLDNGATTFKPQSVIDTITHHYTQQTSNVHRGLHQLSEQATTAYENARATVQQFLNAASEKEIIFTKGTTDAINLVASSLGETLNTGDEIIISEMEHHSNIVPWQMLCEKKGCVLKVAPINDAGEIILEKLESLITAKTKLISVVYISNSLGTINPVEKIIAMAHANDALVLIDAAQAVSHCAIDVQALDCDFLAFSAHKLFGPTGCGVLYGKAAILDTLPPYQGGGDMIETVSFDKTTYNTLPYKFEAGTPNIAGVIGLGAAIAYVNAIDWKQIADHKNNLLKTVTAALQNIKGLTIIGTAQKKAPIISFTIDGIHAHDLGTLVSQEGVAVRTGHHCTMPVMQHYGISATTRASFSWYNTLQEIDTLVKALEQAQSILK